MVVIPNTSEKNKKISIGVKLNRFCFFDNILEFLPCNNIVENNFYHNIFKKQSFLVSIISYLVIKKLPNKLRIINSMFVV